MAYRHAFRFFATILYKTNEKRRDFFLFKRKKTRFFHFFALTRKMKSVILIVKMVK